MKFGPLAVRADDDVLPKTDVLNVKRHAALPLKADMCSALAHVC